MKAALIAATLALAALSLPATAQQYRNDSNWRQAEECWNGQAGRFERVRPGEYQNDLDHSRCRPVGEVRSRMRDEPRECWNGRARAFETVRPGERQDDLDLSRCRRR